MPTRRKHRPPKRPPGEDAIKRMHKREIVNRFGTWEHCGRWACWRSRACRAPAVDCFNEQHEAIQDLIVDEAYSNYRLADISEDQLPEIDL